MININKIIETNHAVLWIISMMIFSNTSFGFAGTISLEHRIITNKKEKPNLDSLNLTVSPVGQDKGQIGYSEYKNIDIPDDNIFKFDIDDKFDFDDNVWLEFDLYGVSDIGSVAFSINDNPSMGGHIVSKSDHWTKQRISLNPQWLSRGINRIQFSKLTENYSIKNLKMVVDKAKKSNNSIVLYYDMKNYPSYNGKVYILGYINSPNKKVKEISINSREIQIVNNSFEMIYKLSDQERAENKLLLNVYFEDGNKETREIILSETGEKGNELLDKVEMIQTQQYSLTSYKEFEINESDFSFILPENSLKNDLHLTVTKLRQKDLPPMNMDITNVTAYHAGYRFLPHGHHFTEEGAILKLAYDKSNIPKGYSEADIQTFYFDIEKSKWISLKRDSIDTKNGFVYSRVQHFTDYINGVIASPESAESTNFTSTYFSDLLKANPMSGIRLINPPSAVPTGEAGVSYPIDVPQGRNGLQPSLAVTYSSDAGSSWVGYGWNLSIPSIDVETRWGVPRYETNIESDAYLLAGQQLVTLDDNGDAYLPHRRDHSSWLPRTEDRRFYNRVESPAGFDKIIRHGDSPTNYWWEVTDRNGTIYYYGSSDGTNLNNNYVIKTSVGNNIAKWLLTKVTDTYGNYILYTYANNTSSASGVNMTSVYIKEITYAHNGTNNYKISFFLSSTDRSDPRIDARTGAIILDNKRLEKIIISGPNGDIKSYVFSIFVGKFKKTLLTKLECLDASGQPFYNHEFSYFDDNNNMGFGSEEDWDTGEPDDVPEAEFVSSLDNVIQFIYNLGNLDSEKKFSPLGGGASHSDGGSIYIGGGTDISTPGKRKTFGMHIGYSSSNSEGRSYFADIDGDGLPDKIYSDGSILYRKNTSRSKLNPFQQFSNNVLNSNLFANSEISINSSNGLKFNEAEEKSYNYGFDAYFNPDAGLDIKKSKNITLSYFSDVNGDGFIDLINNKKVYFNFTGSSGIGLTDDLTQLANCDFTSPMQTAFNNLYVISQTEQDDYYNEHPRIDVVKVWKAPRTGSIIIPATSVTNLDIDGGTGDGVMLQIQHNGNIIYPTDPQNQSPLLPGNMIQIPQQTIDVIEGDRIYFRTMSGNNIEANGENDEVEWDIQIEYQNSVNTTDPYNMDYNIYNYSDDVIPSQAGNITIPQNGTITADFTINVSGNLSDEVYFEILKNDLVVKHEHCPVTVTYVDNSALQMDKYSFRLVSNSNINWNSVNVTNAYVKLEYNVNNILNVNEFIDGEVPIEYHFYREIEDDTNMDFADTRNTINSQLADQTDPNPYSLILSDNGISVNSDIDEEIIVSIKDDNNLYFQQVWNVSGSSGTIPALALLSELKNSSIPANSNVYCTIVSDNKDIFNDWKINKAKLMLKSDASVMQDFIPTLYVYDSDNRYIFNNLYRNWGVFAYNPDGTNVENNLEIVESELVINTSSNSTSAIEQVFWPMKCVADPVEDFWQISDISTAKATRIHAKPSRLLDENATLSNPMTSIVSSGYPGIMPETVSNSSSVNLGGSLSPFDISFTVSSSGKSITNIDYRDLNGDKIPDVIGNNGISYSYSNGDLQFVQGVYGNTTIKNSINASIAAGGNYVHSFSKRSSNEANVQAHSCGQASIGLSGNFNFNESDYEEMWIDVNGDGLPDLIRISGGTSYSVQINLGYALSAQINLFNLPNDDANKSESLTLGLGLGLTLFSGSFTAGVGYTKTKGDNKTLFVDINGDGLVDFLYISNNQIKVKLNTGAEFVDYIGFSFGNINLLNRTRMNGSTNNFGITVPIIFPAVKVAISLGINFAKSMNRVEATFADIDGDGYADFLYSAPNVNQGNIFGKYDDSDIIKVNRSKIGKINKLKQVTNSIGGSFEIDYAQTPATVKHPNGKFVLSKLTVDDGFNQNGNAIHTSFEYDDGYYDRCERVFLGFSKLNIIQEDNSGNIYRTIANEYINTNIYQKGLMTKSSVIEGDYASGTTAKTTTNQYASRTVIPGANNTYSSNAAPADLSSEKEAIINTMLESTGTELNINGNIGETATMIYDDYGNITSYTYDNGSGGYTTTIGYYQNNTANILGIANSMEIQGLREKSAEINAQGKITKLTVQPNSVTEYEYDPNNGNLTKITLPDAGGRPYYEYEYESTLNTFVSKITDNFGFESYNNNYDYRFGVPLEVVDINGNKTLFEYDAAGRIKKFTGPPSFDSSANNNTSSYGANFSYDISALPISATTERHDPESNGTIKSVIYADGFGRTLQTGTQAVVDGAAGTIFSGIPEYDDFGRVVKTYYPTFGYGYNFNSTTNGKVTTTEYDILDRKTKETLPGSRVFRYEYSNDGNNLKTEFIDANTKTSSTISEYNGPVVSQTSNMGYTTVFAYDNINQLKTITPPNGNPSSFVYDLAGRVTSRSTPDAGTTSYTYDGMGNITQQTNQWPINYVYEYGRLKEVNYPQRPQLKVEYEYDDNTPGLKGRVFQIKDGTGSQRFSYGTMGEITKIERSIAIPYKTDAAEFVTEWEYDLWNRVQKMTYPDGEIVTFNYDAGGNLKGFSGVKSGNTYDYVMDIQYDEFGSRKKLVYGNGVVTNYTYKSDERWPETINSQFSGSSLNVTYSSYDKMGNIFSISKNTGNQNFTYDDDYKLLTSSGDWNGSSMFPNQSCGTNGFASDYSSEYTYDNMGNILSKINNINKSTPVNSPYSKYYTLNYSYNGNKINSINEIYNSDNGINTMTRKAEHTYAYDANGNTTKIVQELNDTNNGGGGTFLETKRGIVWQEGDLMRALADDNVVTHFFYDANGERVLKLSEAYHKIFVNSELSGDGSFEIGYTMYVNPYMTVRHDGHYTKHFYIGTERVVSKIGASDDYGTDPTALGLGLPNGKRGSLESLMNKNYSDLGINITFSSGGTSDLGLSGGSGTEETDRYFFTKDHIGSSSIITDATGKPIQQIEYMPFGESYVDWRELSWNTPYRFTGKEQDPETGLYYYGARYYDPRIGRFLSVDPLADKYPNESPFIYAGNNPIKNIDVDGKYKYPSDKDKKYRNNYKKLTNFLENGGIQNYLKNNEIRDALKIIGGYTDNQIDKYLSKWGGNSLEIEIIDMPDGRYGYTPASSLPKMQINKKLALQLENSKSSEEYTAALFAVVSIILHESVHNSYPMATEGKHFIGNTSGSWNYIESIDKAGNLFYEYRHNGVYVGNVKETGDALETGLFYDNSIWDQYEADLLNLRQMNKIIKTLIKHNKQNLIPE